MKENALYRELWPTLDRAPATTATSARLLTGVESFEVRFLDRAGQWHTIWPDSRAADQPLPVAVEVTVVPEKELTLKRIFLVNG
jgi:type II secretion system protein J